MSEYTDKICPIIYSSELMRMKCFGEECAWFSKCYTSTIEDCSKVGEWVRNFDGNEWFWYCSNCKDQWYEEDLWMGGNEFPHYCPNCGSRMKGTDND